MTLPNFKAWFDRLLLQRPSLVAIVFALAMLAVEIAEHRPHSLSELDPHFWIEILVYVVVFPAAVGVILNLLARVRAHSLTAPKAAVEEERRRLSRDLHDSLGHSLGYLHLKLDQLTSDGSLQDVAAVRQELEQMRQVVDDAYAQTRGALATLKAGASTDLATAIMESASAVGQRAGLQVQVASEGQAGSLSPHVRSEILTLFREGLVNVEQHAHARRVDIRLAWTSDALTVKLSDDGSGFDLDALPANGHYGLAIMQERAQNIGGQLVIQSEPGAGARLILQLPFGEKALQSSGRDKPAAR